PSSSCPYTLPLHVALPISFCYIAQCSLLAPMNPKEAITMKKIPWLIVFCFFLANQNAMSQREVNYDEEKISHYELPELLTSRSVQAINDQQDWDNLRRKEILEDFEKYVYGKVPEVPVQVSFMVQKTDEDALGGLAIKKEIVASFRTEKGAAKMNMLLYLPKNAVEKVPVFLGLNFYGNHT